MGARSIDTFPGLRGGLVVYLAFAPEYIVYEELEYDGRAAAHGWPACLDGQDRTGRGADGKLLRHPSLRPLSQRL
jgi:hypothetical protein